MGSSAGCALTARQELKMQIESAEMNQKTMETYQMASSYLKKNQMYERVGR